MEDGDDCGRRSGGGRYSVAPTPRYDHKKKLSIVLLIVLVGDDSGVDTGGSSKPSSTRWPEAVFSSSGCRAACGPVRFRSVLE